MPMNEILLQIVHVLGWYLLWVIGLFIVPVVSGIIAIFCGTESDGAMITFFITGILYLVGTGILLIIIH
jgi:hypothetical protein